MTRYEFEKYNKQHRVISASVLTSQRRVPRNALDMEDLKYTRFRFENGKSYLVGKGVLRKPARWKQA